MKRATDCFIVNFSLSPHRLSRLGTSLLFFATVATVLPANAASASGLTVAIEAPFLPKNENRTIRSLSVHQNGKDWIFVECPEHKNGHCDIMRFNLESRTLFRYALPQEYSYPYAHYSAEGGKIVLNRIPVHDGTEIQRQLSLTKSQILTMQDDGTDLEVIPVTPGVNLAPAISPDGSHIAFWKSEKILPKNNQLILMKLDIWEYGISSKSEKLFYKKNQAFITGGRIQYINNSEIIFPSYGPDARFESNMAYREKYGGSEVFRTIRNQESILEPVVYQNIYDSNLPSADKKGNTFIWGNMKNDRSLGVVRITPDGFYTIWRTRTAFTPLEMVVDPNGNYVAAIYRDTQTYPNSRSGGFAKLDIHTGIWSWISIPNWNAAEVLPVLNR
ncbi:hypothetical protein KDH83_18145 [Achromobacter sp. Marseille-Q0513]|uniref:hypothetical protein n=1 Tax=Achromobacter sp. Marseille-Q0513 TaxID=2829161 RepID=UPI001B8E3A68|nr:hypothetical protein [Achromobacter sp. Marseille-Q0513]MBR8655228.1 hypothetical protein [Achromobacter sp. Marseille-Q0513]